MRSKVLVLEDEPAVCAELKGALKQLGCLVIGPVSTCAAALEAIWQTEPDMAFLDTHLGTETCQVVLEECERLGVPVVVNSVLADDDLPAFAAGRPHLPKPYEPETIEAMLGRLAA